MRDLFILAGVRFRETVYSLEGLDFIVHDLEIGTNFEDELWSWEGAVAGQVSDAEDRAEAAEAEQGTDIVTVINLGARKLLDLVLVDLSHLKL